VSTNSVRNTERNKNVLIGTKIRTKVRTKVCTTYSRYYLARRARLTNLSRTSFFVLPIVLFFFLFLSASAAQANACTSQSFDKRAVVTQVYDGDTVKLANGDKIRLIGINTPEMNYKTGDPEPYAVKAKRFLEKRVLRKKIGIKYGRESKDRYKRTLAHVFLLDGTNLQYEILKAGLAFNISIPPNLGQQRCYRDAEGQAQTKQIRVWKSPYFKPVNALKVNKHQVGFKRISGKVSRVLETKKTIWIKFSEKMAIRISKKDLHYFKNFQPQNLVGKQIKAKGWISLYKRRFSMRVKHPDAISFK